MLDAPTIERLKEISIEIKEVAPTLNGQIIFNCSKHLPKPKVTVTACDVTEGKK